MAETHKNNIIPLIIVVSCINLPVSQLSEYYKNVSIIACDRPEYVMKNSSHFINKLKTIIW